jgi:hypothetical protein
MYAKSDSRVNRPLSAKFKFQIAPDRKIGQFSRACKRSLKTDLFWCHHGDEFLEADPPVPVHVRLPHHDVDLLLGQHHLVLLHRFLQLLRRDVAILGPMLHNLLVHNLRIFVIS